MTTPCYLADVWCYIVIYILLELYVQVFVVLAVNPKSTCNVALAVVTFIFADVVKLKLLEVL